MARLVPVSPAAKHFLVTVIGETNNCVYCGRDLMCDHGTCNKLYCIPPTAELPSICERCDDIFVRYQFKSNKVTSVMSEPKKVMISYS